MAPATGTVVSVTATNLLLPPVSDHLKLTAPRCTIACLVCPSRATALTGARGVEQGLIRPEARVERP